MWESSQSGRGRFPFRLAGPLIGQLLRGSCGTPHNEFYDKSQVLPTVVVDETYVPIWMLLSRLGY